jgi:hypothetical protein
MLVVLYDDRRGVGVLHRVIGKGVAADDVQVIEVERRRLADENAQLREALKERHGLGPTVDSLCR